MGLVNHASFARFSFNCPSVRCTIICHQYSFMGTISFGHSVMALRSKEEGAFVAWGRPRPHTYIFLTISSGSARHYRVAGQDITQEIDGNYAAAKQGQVKPSYQLLLIFPPSPMWHPDQPPSTGYRAPRCLRLKCCEIGSSLLTRITTQPCIYLFQGNIIVLTPS